MNAIEMNYSGPPGPDRAPKLSIGNCMPELHKNVKSNIHYECMVKFIAAPETQVFPCYVG